MPSVPIVCLQDSSGQSWRLGVNNAALVQTSPVAGSAPLSIVLADAAGAAWKLTVEITGELSVIEASDCPASQLNIPVIAPNGTSYVIQIEAVTGLMQTALGSGLCPFPLADALTALGSRLADSGSQFWTDAEKTLYIQEAFRTWNALTAYWRGDFLITTVRGEVFYDLSNDCEITNTLRGRELTAADLLTVMQYQLLEPPVGVGAWAGSTQFSQDDLAQALRRRRDECVGASGCSIKRILVPANAGRTVLPDTVVDIRRVAFIPAPDQGPPVVLWQTDEWALQQMQARYTTSAGGTPEYFSVSTEPWLEMDVYPQPNVPGQYEILAVATGVVGTEPTPSQLEVPDDWTWVLKWGALADLLSRESSAKDELRAKYCEMRYRQGMSMLAVAPALLALRLNNVPLQIDGIKAADTYQTSWQSRAQGPPDGGYIAGMDLLAVTPPPSVGPFSMTATVVMNAPVPTAGSPCLQIGRDLYDIVVDYAHHLAAFKMGGAEFVATMPMLERFVQAALLYASKLSEQAEFQRVIYSLQAREQALDPRYSALYDPATPETNADSAAAFGATQ